MSDVYQISDNRIDADDQKINELIADGILNRVPTPVYWIDRGAIRYQGTLAAFFTTSVDEMVKNGILALLNPSDDDDVGEDT